MAENLTEDDAQLILGILDGWSANKKLTWEALIEEIAFRRHGSTWSRQALSRHQDIIAAFRNQKNKIRTHSLASNEPREDISPELTAALKTIERLESEKARLSDEKNSYKELFVVWAYNAHCFNISEEMLSKPLPLQDRRPSKNSEKNNRVRYGSQKY